MYGYEKDGILYIPNPDKNDKKGIEFGYNKRIILHIPSQAWKKGHTIVYPFE